MNNRAIAIIAALAVLSPVLLHVEKTVWVMFRYSEPKFMAWGMAISLLIAFWASRRMRLSAHVALLVAATLPLWIAMFLAADSGYRNWQSSANAPAEAYADTGPIFFLIAGWLPGWGIVYLLRLLFQRIFPRPPVSPPPLPSHPK
jgi:peptidoglycan/LPS O-acetylase OafA/YrhL